MSRFELGASSEPRFARARRPSTGCSGRNCSTTSPSMMNGERRSTEAWPGWLPRGSRCSWPRTGPMCEDWSTSVAGEGVLVAAMLARNPEMHGIVFDLPAAADEATRHLSGCDVEGRWEIRSGDFFAGVPGGADLHVLSQVLHDWSDDECLQDSPRLSGGDSTTRPARSPRRGRTFRRRAELHQTPRPSDAGDAHRPRAARAEWRELLAAGGFTLRRLPQPISVEHARGGTHVVGRVLARCTARPRHEP